MVKTTGAALLLAVALLVSGCGSSGSPASSPSPSEKTMTPSELPDPTPTGKRDAVTTVTGVVGAGVEAGCLLLDAGGEQLLLLGARPDQVSPGDRVTVTGVRRPDAMTTCQQGLPFEVRELRPAP